MACTGMQYFYDPVAENPWQTNNIPTFVYDLSGNPIETPLYASEGTAQVYPKSEEPGPKEEEKIRPSGEVGIPIMEAIACGVEQNIPAVNVANTGAIPSLPDDMVVEVPAIANGNGIQPQQMEPLPTGITAMIQLQGNIHKLLIEAYVEKSRKKLLQAVLIDPTISNYNSAVAMINEMCELQKDLLPPLYW